MEIKNFERADKMAKQYNCLGEQITALSAMATVMATEKVDLKFTLHMHDPAKEDQNKSIGIEIKQGGINVFNLEEFIKNASKGCACCTQYEDDKVDISTMLKMIALLIRDKNESRHKVKLELAKLGVTV